MKVEVTLTLTKEMAHELFVLSSVNYMQESLRLSDAQHYARRYESVGVVPKVVQDKIKNQIMKVQLYDEIQSALLRINWESGKEEQHEHL